MAMPEHDRRPAAVLACVGRGLNAEESAAEVGIAAKTISRWRSLDRGIPGYRQAYTAVKRLSKIMTRQALDEIEAIVAEWTPGGLLDGVRSAAVDVDVIGASGRTLVAAGPAATGSSPYTDKRAPTPDEWCSMMAAVAVDKTEPERVRLGAQAAVTAMLAGGPVGRINRARAEQLVDEQIAEAARERGRDAGVPAEVWEQVRLNVLGPMPRARESDGDEDADVGKLNQAAPG